MSMAAGDPALAQPAARPRRMVGPFPLSYWVIGAGGIAGFVGWRYYKGRQTSAAGALTGATGASSVGPSGSGLVPTAGYGSVNAPSGGGDWSSVLAQFAALQSQGGNMQTQPPGSTLGTITNPPQVAYGAKDPTHPILVRGKPLLDELTGVKRWISAPAGANIPGGPVGYGASGGENQPDVYTVAGGATYSELPGGSAFESTLGSCQPIFWQPQPGTFVKYPTKQLGAGRGCARAPGSPAYGTPVFVQQ